MGDPEKDTGWRLQLVLRSPSRCARRAPTRRLPVANDLTRLFLERVVPGFKNPVIVLRWTDDLRNRCGASRARDARQRQHDGV